MKIVESTDGWGRDSDGCDIVPRSWQAEALPVILSHYSKPSPSRGVIHAVTGSGKSTVIAEICARFVPDENEVVVVSTSRQKLVRQIRQTIKDRLEVSDDFMAAPVVGAYYSDCKEFSQHRVVVCCNDSLKSLAEALEKIGKHCPFLIVDELHHSESPTMKLAYDTLMPRMAIGFSATPFRPNPKQGISNFDEVIYKIGVERALADKIIVPWTVEHWEGGETDLDSACLTMMKEFGQNGRGVVNALTVDDALLFAKMCTENDYPVKVVSSRLSDRENDEILEELRTRKIKAVCHCDLLSEGVDLKFLEFLCLRRIVSSRNRFVQELGRGIRYFFDKETGQEKKCLTVLDPSELVSQFRLSYDAVLSGDFDPDDEAADNEPEGKRMERALQQECFNVIRHLTAVRSNKEAFSTGPLNSYLSQLVSVFDTFGLLEKKISSRDWRKEPASQKQIDAMDRMKWALKRKQVPTIHQKALEILTGFGTKMTRGMGSDLISLEMSLADKSTWPKFSQLDQVVADGLARHEKKKTAMSAPKPSPFGTSKPTAQAVVQGLLFGDLGAKKK